MSSPAAGVRARSDHTEKEQDLAADGWATTRNASASNFLVSTSLSMATLRLTWGAYGARTSGGNVTLRQSWVEARW